MALPANARQRLDAMLACSNLALIECRERSTGRIVPIIVGVTEDGDSYTLEPFAELFTDDATDRYDPPAPNGGFDTNPETVEDK